MIEELQETLQSIETVNKLLKRNLITFDEFLKLKIELYEKANKINEILELEYEYKNALSQLAKEIFKNQLKTRNEEN
nr:MAG TPA: hypothetical protein [Caudoviricetes sp.]